MKAGYLSQYFSGVAIKRLTSVEANPYSSNQHEFNGVSDLKKIFGKANGKIRFDTKFLYFNDYDDEPVAADDALIAWLEREEILFRTFERYQLAERLKKGFSNDVEGFLSFSLSVQNRRKSRIGYALENHLEEIFNSCGVYYSRTKITENKSKPDFIFPSVEKYHDNTFNPQLLTMLGVKNTCKDRWRQVLSEADKIEYKHLLTLETAISENQTNEMKDKKLQLVLPRSLHYTYNNSQQSWIIDFNTFINVVKEKQKNVYQIRY